MKNTLRHRSARLPAARSRRHPLLPAALIVPLALLAPALAPAAEPIAPGNCNGDAAVDIADVDFLLRFLFLGEAVPPCFQPCDFQQDGSLDITDALDMLGFLFAGGPAPGPLPAGACGQPGHPELDLEWNPVVRDAQGNPEEDLQTYRVYVRPEVPDASMPGPRLVKEVGTDCSCATVGEDDLASLLSGRRYFLSVTAVDGSGNESARSNEVPISW